MRCYCCGRLGSAVLQRYLELAAPCPWKSRGTSRQGVLLQGRRQQLVLLLLLLLVVVRLVVLTKVTWSLLVALVRLLLLPKGTVLDGWQ